MSLPIQGMDSPQIEKQWRCIVVQQFKMPGIHLGVHQKKLRLYLTNRTEFRVSYLKSHPIMAHRILCFILFRLFRFSKVSIFLGEPKTALLRMNPDFSRPTISDLPPVPFRVTFSDLGKELMCRGVAWDPSFTAVFRPPHGTGGIPPATSSPSLCQPPSGEGHRPARARPSSCPRWGLPPRCPIGIYFIKNQMGSCPDM